MKNFHKMSRVFLEMSRLVPRPTDFQVAYPSFLDYARHLDTLLPDWDETAAGDLNSKRKKESNAISKFKNIEEVRQVFGLTAPRKRELWKIPKPKIVVPENNPFLERFIESRNRNFSRSSEAICRTAVDVLLNECLILLVCVQRTCQRTHS